MWPVLITRPGKGLAAETLLTQNKEFYSCQKTWQNGRGGGGGGGGGREEEEAGWSNFWLKGMTSFSLSRIYIADIYI